MILLSTTSVALLRLYLGLQIPRGRVTRLMSSTLHYKITNINPRLTKGGGGLLQPSLTVFLR